MSSYSCVTARLTMRSVLQTQGDSRSRSGPVIRRVPRPSMAPCYSRWRRRTSIYMHLHISSRWSPRLGIRLALTDVPRNRRCRADYSGRPVQEETTMPFAKIHVLEGQYDGARLARVSSAIQDGLVSTLGIPPDDFFQIIHVLPRSQFLHTPSFLGLNYSYDLTLLELPFISARPKETLLGLLKALNDGVVSAAGVSPDDLFIVIYEIPGENVSFGRGLAQRARIPDAESAAAYAHRA